MAPIIVPIVATRTRDCVVVDGHRYCESGEITKQDALAIGFGVLAWAVQICCAGKVEITRKGEK